MIQIENLHVRYGQTHAVRGLDLQIEAGQLFALLGPNGAGKTSTLRCLSGLMTPTDGRMEVAGLDPGREPAALRRKMGVVPQELALYPTLSVLENLRVFAGLAGLGKALRRERIGWALELAQLEPQRRSRVSKLSGGMKRRLNLVASLLHDPQLIICDEPTTGVDAQSRAHLFETIRRLHQEGRTIVYTTHILGDVEALCTHVGIMDAGQLLLQDTLENATNTATRSQTFSVTVDGDGVLPESLANCLEAGGFGAVEVAPGRGGLEKAFLEVTGHALRDDE